MEPSQAFIPFTESLTSLLPNSVGKRAEVLRSYNAQNLSCKEARQKYLKHRNFEVCTVFLSYIFDLRVSW